MDDQIKLSVRARGSIKAKLTNLEKYIAQIKALDDTQKPSLAEVELRITTNQSLLSEFEELQKHIEALCSDEDLEKQYTERSEFTERYCTAFAFLTEFKQKYAPAEHSSTSPNMTSSSSHMQFNHSMYNNVVLPPIKLTSFKGDYEHWLDFKASFVSVVHENSHLSKTQKFQYLKASLDGYAKRIIENIGFTENAYDSAWSLLCQRFDNKRVLIHNHIKSISNLEQLHKESAIQLRQMLDNVSKHLAALDSLKLTKDMLWDNLVIHIISNKLDKASHREWKEFKCAGTLPKLDEFFNFLRSKVDLLETLQDVHQNSNQNTNTFKQNTQAKKQSQCHLALNSFRCNYCKGQHLIYNCADFLKLDIPTRIEKVNTLKLCNNCLKSNHSTAQCKLSHCKKCIAHHNTLLHQDSQVAEAAEAVNLSQIKHDLDITQSDVPIISNNESGHTAINLLAKHTLPQSQVLLSTVSFKVKDVHGNMHTCRAVLDSGAQSSLVTEQFCKQLDLPLQSTKMSIVGINQVVSNLTQKCELQIFSNYNNFKSSISCYVVPAISSEMPNYRLSMSKLKIPSNIQFSDPEFFEPSEVNVLIGASLFWDLLLDGKITLGKGLPVLQNTQLGWVVSGTAPISSNKCSLQSHCNLIKSVVSEDEQLKRFWELEEIQGAPSMSPDEIQCEDLFLKTTFQNQEGRFVVQLPLKYSPNLLGDSQDSAIKRFLSLERKFILNPAFKAQYKHFIDEYASLGHMNKVNNLDNDDLITYYLPHHGVVKSSSLTTKLRVVFDGSSPSDSGWSLNDLQHVGPKVQNEIFSILIRFRTCSYVVSADVTKMYRQILMHPDHRPLQRIIWRDDPTHDFSVYELNTVTYGTTAAPYLAIKCMNQLAINNQTKFPLASEVILKDFYVDDLLTGCNDMQDLASICEQVSSILESGGFSLRKWISNSPDVLSKINHSDDTLGILRLGENESSKTLGIQWFSHQDILKYEVSLPPISDTVTKRKVLSIISQIYDPLGLVSPCIIVCKILIQKLWTLKLAWDDPLPPELYTQWSMFRDQLSLLNKLEIPRTTVEISYKILDIHCFSDASQNAYSSCVYVRSQKQDGHISVNLLCSKTKVAPVKSISIPRLELCAAHLSVQLMTQVKQALQFLGTCHYWTDSQVVLCWLNTEPSLLEIFVANRVTKIQNSSKIQDWRYVNTKQNPADVASRGILPKRLLDCDLWWKGPSFLYKSDDDWQDFSVSIPKHEIPELKRKRLQVFSVVRDESLDIFNKFSNLVKLKRVTAYCFRFYNNIKSNVNMRKYSSLSASEIDRAYLRLIKLAQLQSFPDEIAILLQNKLLPKKHKFSTLNPYLDDQGLLRVGGRLQLSSLDYNTKHPLLLSSKHNLTKLIFTHKHASLLHPGPQLLLASVRQRYWPIGGRNLAKATVKNCITCFKFKPSAIPVPMGAIPEHRLTPSLPFQIVGMDYAGPFSMKTHKGRGSKITKCYICLFVCFVTKSLHLELVTDMTTECFLACFRRFTSRRGVPTHVYSDNGSTFIGANNELKELGQFLINNQDKIFDYASNNQITWHFTPPYSPNFGGLWEAAVKITKYHLKRTMRDVTLTYEEFATLLIQIEGILNSRPLFAMSNDPNDCEPITPSHFLIGRPLTSLPETTLIDIPVNRLSKLQHVQQIQQHFWKRFSNEYISQLNQMYKWRDPPISIQLGTLVLIGNDNQPSNRWLLGRIIQLFPGADGVARVALVKTSRGILKRSTRHLHPLPIEESACSE